MFVKLHFVHALKVAAAAICLSLAGLPSARAQEVLSSHGDWTAYAYKENGQKVCYIASRPAKQEGSFKKRSEPYAIVTRREAGKDSEEISVTAGYPYKENGKVEVSIGGALFTLFTENDWAWAQNEAGDKEMVAAMVHGTSMTVKAESRVGTSSIDTYSLNGFSAARKAIAEACG
jgi:invasion protein IalB